MLLARAVELGEAASEEVGDADSGPNRVPQPRAAATCMTLIARRRRPRERDQRMGPPSATPTGINARDAWSCPASHSNRHAASLGLRRDRLHPRVPAAVPWNTERRLITGGVTR
jgi:hypothetical protein